jgi:hypothetical protein
MISRAKHFAPGLCCNVIPHQIHSIFMEGRMKEDRITLKVILSITMIFALFITAAAQCNANPQVPGKMLGTLQVLPPVISKPSDYEIDNPPVKVLGTIIPWWKYKINIKYIPPWPPFWFGSPECNPGSKGDQVMRVKMPGFFMFEGPVTNGLYAACEESGVCTPPQTSDQGPCSQYRDSKFADMPVVCVNWFQANAFCQWVEGKLPSQAQWEDANCKGTNGMREWVNDWFDPTARLLTLFNPTGPSEGKQRLILGGGQPDSGLAPETTNGDVGFRCVPTPPEYAPFCPPGITQLCADPNIPTSDKPCTPGSGVSSINSFGCPANGRVAVVFDTNGGGNSGYAVVVGDQKYPCEPYTSPDLIKCSIPEQHMGATISLTVCGGGDILPTPVPASAAIGATGGNILASLAKNDPLNVRAADVPYCPPGYIWKQISENKGECVLKPDADCPKGWFLSALLDCQPSAESSCPPGTKWNPNLGGCAPEKNCPDGFVLTERKTCVPEQNDRKLCPAGYYFNKAAQCCQPIRGNNYNCDKNHYFDPTYKRCMPIDGNGCGFNFVYDFYGRCISKPYEDTQAPGEGQCPGNLTFTAPNICNTPPNGFNNEKPDPLRRLLPGDTRTPDGLVELGDDGHVCSPGSAFVAAFNNCVNRDENKCPYGYHFSADQKECIPDYGPGSTCPLGTKFQERLGCCAPIPGFDGSRCPQDPKSAIGANIDTADPLQVYGMTFYNPLQGTCDSGKPGEEQTPQCPAGYPATNTQPCPSTENADGSLPECKSNEYFDKILGYCVLLQPDCCQLGESFSALLKRCAPDVGNPPRNGKICEKGYELVKDQCLLIEPYQGGQCVTISVNVPTCYGPCKVGFTYRNGQCVKTNPCADVNCLICQRNQNCPPGCC